MKPAKLADYLNDQNDSVLAPVNSIQTTGTLNAHSDEQRDGERPKRGYGNGIDPDYRCIGAAVWRRRILWSQPRVLVIANGRSE
jgi:hypothetical protein